MRLLDEAQFDRLVKAAAEEAWRRGLDLPGHSPEPGQMMERPEPPKPARAKSSAANRAADVTPGQERLILAAPHIAVQDHVTKTGKRRKTKIDGRTTRHPGYGVSQRCRKRIEEVFGWVKTSAGLSKTKFRGRHRVDASFTLALAAYNLVRLPRLLAEAPT